MMKRLLIFFLCAIMLLTACATPDDTSSQPSDESVAESTDTTSETSEPSENSDGSIDEDTNEPYPEDCNYTLVSFGKPYTTTQNANETYPDLYNQQITDGQKAPNEGAHYIDTRMVGYTTANCVFQIDLGDDWKRINRIVARSLVMSKDGVAIAASASFSGSKDGKTFKDFGTLNFEDTGDLSVSEAVMDIETVTNCRYIRVQINRGYGHFFFLDEIEVYADVPAKEKDDFAAIAYENENIDRQAWLELSTGVAATPAETVVVSVNSEYSFENCGFDSRAPQNDTILTDGARTNQYFSESVWVGIVPEEDKDASVTVFLDALRSNIYSFKVHALGGGVDVDYPAYIDVYASRNSSTYSFIGRMYGPVDGDNFVYSLVLPEYIRARNVRFVFPKDSGNCWVEEIEIIAGYNEEQPDVVYPDVVLPEVTEELYWNSSESDYNVEQNLLLGKSQQISPLFYADVNKYSDNSKVDFPYLTDGKRAVDTFCYSGEWFFSSGSGLEFFYDLEKLTSVSSVTVSALEQTDWGIARPRFISVFLSENGDDWYEVKEYNRGDTEMSAAALRVEIPLEFDKAYAARFIRIRVESGTLFIDELEAFGTKAITSETCRLADSGIKSVPFYTHSENEVFATSENTPIKANNIPLIAGNTMTAETLLPYVAYLDEEGNIKDTFMDGFHYCLNGTIPSGGQAHAENYKQDWEYMYNTTFNGQGGLDVLEATVQKVKDALNLPDYKVQVFITLFTLSEKVTDFGDVDGDGVGENLSKAEDRKKVIDWYMNKCETEFNSRGYKNLEIGAYYWIAEAVEWSVDNSHIISEVADYVHQNGGYFFWIPYSNAHRNYTGYELGFDLVSVQPNVVFTTDAPLWRFEYISDMAKKHNMCVEIEHSYQCLGDIDFARNYMLYLYHGAVTGYMDAVNIYYNDTDNFAQMAYSDSALCRLQYDATYQYAKGTLNITPETKETLKLSGKSNTVISGNLNENGEVAKFTLVTPPQHGYLTFDDDGTFRYFPDKDYKGTDSFTYTYNNLLGESSPCTVEIIVD